MESQTYQGEWWLPADPEHRVYGELTYEPRDGITIDIRGSLGQQHDPMSPRAMDTLFGEVYEEGPVTVKDLSWAGSSGFGGSGAEQSFRAQLAYARDHFNPEEEITFEELGVSFYDLLAWADQNALRTEPDERGRSISAIPQNVISDTISVDGIDFRINTGCSISRDARSAEFSQSSAIRIVPDEPMNISEYRNYIWYLQRYLSLAFSMPVHPSVIKGSNELEEPSRETLIFYQMSRFSKPEKNLNPHKLQFTRTDVDFEDSLQRWINHSEDAGDLHDFYFSIVYDPDMSIQYNFLALSIALESYYDYHYPDHKPMDQEEFRELQEELVSQIPDDVPVKERIENLMGSIVNDLSFKDKLEEVILEYEPVINALLDIDDSLRRVRDTRHGIVHALDMGEMTHAASDPEDLIELTYHLRVIIEAILYDVVGLDNSDITSILRERYTAFIE